MSLQFPRGKIVGPGELEIALVDQNGNPTDAYRITYTLYDATTGVEVPIGQIDRVPVRQELGLYYAHFQIPMDAALGLYRIRWIIQQTTVSPPNVVMEEFKVMLPETFEKTLWTPIQSDMLRSLRILLRDNCIAGEEVIEVKAGNERIAVSMLELWELLKDG